MLGELSGTVGLAGRVLALAVFDDGAGPALFAGGSSLLVEGGLTRHLVKWTGTAWQGVAAGPNNPVRALAVFDDGRGAALYVGGDFSAVGANVAKSLARWNGQSWEEVGGGVLRYRPGCSTSAGAVYALRVFDDGSGPALFVAGDLRSAGGLATDLVARWSGSGWTPMGTPPDGCSNGGVVYALQEYGPSGARRLHAGGSFNSIGGVATGSIARWESSSWVDLAGGVGQQYETVRPGVISALAVFGRAEDEELVAAGLFDRAGSSTDPIVNVARWNGERWAGLGAGLRTTAYSPGMPQSVQALSVIEDAGDQALVASGSIVASGSMAVSNLAQWDGARWRTLGGGISAPSAGGMALATHQGSLVVAGGFKSAGGLGANGIAAWNGREWSVYGEGLDDAVEALALFDDGTGPSLVAGGRFLSAGKVVLNRIGRWTGTAWEPLGAGLDDEVLALETAVEGGMPVLYAGGRFARAGDVPALSVARWSAGQWSALGEGLNQGLLVADPGAVHALEAIVEAGQPVLFAGGEFQRSGEQTLRNIARWSGGSWHPLGNGLGRVRALLWSGVGGSPRLFAGGDFDAAYDGTLLRGIGWWDGTAWSPLGSGLTYESSAQRTVRALAEWPDGQGLRLVVAGRFSAAGGVGASNAASWNGTQWSGSPGFGSELAEALAPWDDLVGPRLALAGDTATLRAAYATGSASTLLAPQFGQGPILAAVSQESSRGATLFLGGGFSRLLGVPVSGLAGYRRPLACGDTTPPAIAFSSPSRRVLGPPGPPGHRVRDV